MITAASVIRGSAGITLAKPHPADRIAAEVVKMVRARYVRDMDQNEYLLNHDLDLDEWFLVQQGGPCARLF